MTKTSRARYTLEFKQEAVQLVKNGQSIAAVARTLEWLTRRCSTGSRLIDRASSQERTPSAPSRLQNQVAAR